MNTVLEPRLELKNLVSQLQMVFKGFQYVFLYSYMFCLFQEPWVNIKLNKVSKPAWTGVDKVTTIYFVLEILLTHRISRNNVLNWNFTYETLYFE